MTSSGKDATPDRPAEASVPSPRRQKQLSLFGVEAAPPTALDLEGVLAGAGQVTRMGGTARVSVVVDAPWRVAVLLEECASRGLSATWEAATVDGHLGVRTAYSAALAPLGTRWLRGAVKAAPRDFSLDGRRLRLWAAASGSPDGPRGYALRLGPGDGEATWKVIGAALSALGVPGELIGPRAGGPAFRTVGRRRLARLSELVGDPPRHAPPEVWPR